MFQVFRTILITLLIILIALTLAFWFAVPPLARQYLEHFFEQQGAEFTAAHLRLNPLQSAVEIENLQIVKDGTIKLSAPSVVVSLRLPDLLNRRLHISDVQAQGLELQIERIASGWSVAGVDIHTSDAATTTLQGWHLELPNADIQGSRIWFRSDLARDEITLRRLKLSNVTLDSDQQRGRMEFLGSVNQAEVSFQSDFLGREGDFEAFTDVTTKQLPLDRLASLLPEAWLGSKGTLSLTSNTYFRWNGGVIVAELANTEMELQEARLLHPPFSIDSSALRLSSPNLEARIQDGRLVDSVGTVRFESDATKVFHQSEQRPLVDWDSLATQSATLDLRSEAIFRIPEATLTGLTLSHLQRENDRLPALLHAKALRFEGLTYGEGHLGLELAAMQDVDSHIVLSQTREPLNVLDFAAVPSTGLITADSPETTASPAPSQEEQHKAGTAENTEVEADFSFSLQRLDVTGTSTFTLVDRGVAPEFVRTLVVGSFHLDRLDTRQPQQTSSFELLGNADGYSSFRAEGTFQPFAERFNMHMTASMQEADLPPLSVYLRRALGYEFRTGQLDLNLYMSIQEGRLAGQSRMLLRGADLRPVKDLGQASASSTLIPLGAALNMLKDDNGNVELEVPLAGDIDNPSFNLNGYISRKLGKAILQDATAYAVQAFVPYAAVVTIAQLASEHMLRLRFKPLELEPGQLPGQAHEEFFQQFNQLLMDRSNLQVKICGVATPADLQREPGTQDLTEAEREQLQQLAGERASAFKQQVVNLAQVKSSRLLTCNAGIDYNKSAKPRIDLDT